MKIPFHFFNREKQKKETVKRESFYNPSDVSYKTAKENMEQMLHYFQKTKKSKFNKNDPNYSEHLKDRTTHYQKYGYKDDFLEILSSNKNMYWYWLSIEGINKVTQEAVINLYAALRDSIKLPDLETIIGKKFLSDYDVIDTLITSLLDEADKSSTHQDVVTASIVEYAKIIRTDMEIHVSNTFKTTKEDRGICNAYRTTSYYQYLEFTFENIPDNKTRWDFFIGALSNSRQNA